MKLKEPIEQVMAGSGAKFGLALRHLESGEELLFDADSYYVLASTFKVPVLVEAFFQIQAGRLTLAERLPLRTADKNLPSGVLTFFEDGLTPTVRSSPMACNARTADSRPAPGPRTRTSTSFNP